MRNDTTAHIQPLVLWQCACGSLDLPKRDYLHIVACSECKTLGDAISDALRDIENTLSLQQPHIGAS